MQKISSFNINQVLCQKEPVLTAFEGIYIHFPFCRSICPFCHFSVKKFQPDATISYIDALIKEIDLWSKKIINPVPIQSIYLGGGTPSLIPIKYLNQVLNKIAQYFQIESQTQITLEANPEDISAEFLSALEDTAINRLSIGIQSLNQKNLQYLGRIHDEQACLNSLKFIQQSKLDNINIDYMFGYPTLNMDDAVTELKRLLASNIQHISLYCLNIETGTPFNKNKYLKSWINKNENDINKQYQSFLKILTDAELNQYEISNFAKTGFESKQNHIYWGKKGYLGLGNSAHSYLLSQRWSNLKNINIWKENINQKKLPIDQVEHLSQKQQIDEYIMIHLRREEGMNLIKLKEKFNLNFNDNYHQFRDSILKKELIFGDINSHLKLTNKGKLLVDEITLQLTHFLNE